MLKNKETFWFTKVTKVPSAIEDLAECSHHQEVWCEHCVEKNEIKTIVVLSRPPSFPDYHFLWHAHIYTWSSNYGTNHVINTWYFAPWAHTTLYICQPSHIYLNNLIITTFNGILSPLLVKPRCKASSSLEGGVWNRAEGGARIYIN